MWILTAVSIAQAAALTPTATPKRLLKLFAPKEDAVLCSPTTKAPLAVSVRLYNGAARRGGRHRRGAAAATRTVRF